MSDVQLCGERMYVTPDRTVHCDLDAHHHGMHEADAATSYSARVRWNGNAIYLMSVVA